MSGSRKCEMHELIREGAHLLNDVKQLAVARNVIRRSSKSLFLSYNFPPSLLDFCVVTWKRQFAAVNSNTRRNDEFQNNLWIL